jgi:hypothetical protein
MIAPELAPGPANRGRHTLGKIEIAEEARRKPAATTSRPSETLTAMASATRQWLLPSLATRKLHTAGLRSPTHGR